MADLYASAMHRCRPQELPLKLLIRGKVQYTRGGSLEDDFFGRRGERFRLHPPDPEREPDTSRQWLKQKLCSTSSIAISESRWNQWLMRGITHR